MGFENNSGGQRVVWMLLACALLVGILYFGREVLIPLAMAVLLMFLLAPVVTYLERRGLHRVAAVGLVIVVILSGTGAIAWGIGTQLTDLAIRLPSYKNNLKAKVASMKFTGGAMEEIQKTIQEVSESAEQPAAKEAADVTGAAGEALPDPKDEIDPSGKRLPGEIANVRIVPDEAIPYDKLTLLADNVLTPLANAAIIVVLVIFMLINREDLRNRVVRLAGARLTLTTRTLDDIGTRISRYLLMNAIVNGAFGIAVGLGLTLIGVEYALMWGFLAALLRFLPYVGPIMAAVMPISMAFIQFPGDDWMHPLMAAGLFVVLELITNNVIEPLAYGHSTGVSTVALLVSAVFWTWVWGPMGLVLAVPLTVVVTVLGEHVTPLQSLAILLGDKPALEPHVLYYQRLLAGDVEEASSILEEHVSAGPLIEVYDNVLALALVEAEKDHAAGELNEETHQLIWQTTQELIDELAPGAKNRDVERDQQIRIDSGPALKARVIGCPAHDAADEMALLMLQQNMAIEGGEFEVLSSTMLASEMIAKVVQQCPEAVLISSLGPVGVRQTRYLCKRLRQAHPSLRIIICRLGYAGDRQRLEASLKHRGADDVATSLAATRDLLQRLMPLPAAAPPKTSNVTEPANLAAAGS
jgi:predicted PurR-regulated permease PerM